MTDRDEREGRRDGPFFGYNARFRLTSHPYDGFMNAAADHVMRTA